MHNKVYFSLDHPSPVVYIPSPFVPFFKEIKE